MRKRQVEITPDYVMKSVRLCWRARDTGKWGQSPFVRMQERYAQSLIAELNNRILDGR